MQDQSPKLKHLMGCRCASIVTMPRAGSEYLQSLLDGNEEILVFILNFQFFSEYRYSSRVICGRQMINGEDFIYEYVGTELKRLRGRYCTEEGLQRLGKNGDQELSIDKARLIRSFFEILGKEEGTLKEIFLSLYGAYHEAVGRSVYRVKVVIHHSHWLFEHNMLKEEFPDVRKIVCLRDPRASLKSMVVNVKRNRPENYHYQGLLNALGVISEIQKELCSGEESIYIRLEDLPRYDTIERLLNSFGVSFCERNTVSTWADILWGGDSISNKKFDGRETSRQVL